MHVNYKNIFAQAKDGYIICKLQKKKTNKSTCSAVITQTKTDNIRNGKFFETQFKQYK